MKLSQKTIDYISGQWGLSYSSECDAITMLWSSGYFEETAKLLVEAGAVESNCPEAKEMIKIAKNTSDKDVQDAIDQCLEQDNALYSCPECGHYHYINCLYFDGTNDWPCDGCGTIVNLKKEA